jgi:hypothetical protein
MRGRPFDGPFQPSPILNVACDRRRTKAVAASVCADSSMLAPPAPGELVPAGTNVRSDFRPEKNEGTPAAHRS